MASKPTHKVAISDLDDMPTVPGKPTPGDTVKRTVWRNGQTRRLSVVLTATE